MATVNNVIVANFPPVSNTLPFNVIWKLTRAMKKAGWKFKASGDGTTKITNSNPASDGWGANTSISNAGAAAASIAAPTRGRSTITGLTGIVAADKGRFLRFSGAATGANNNDHQIEEILSATSVRIDARNFAVASDANNGSITWSVRDPLGETYPGALATVAAWWTAQGPSILKIPLTVASTGTFTKGENVTQSTTGAEGEILGYVLESGVGYLTISPRLRGTGTGVYGWDTANTITGDSSGATVSQNGTALEYRNEVVFWKNATETSGGTVFHGCFEPVAQSGELFSFLAASAGCTATVPPGQGGTGNTFPTRGVATWAGTAITTAVVWFTGSSSYGNSQIIAVDAIEEENQSADASYFAALAHLGVAGGGHTVHAFCRLDDTEDGDLYPFTTICPGTGETIVSNNRTIGAATAGVTDTLSLVGFMIASATTTFMKAWRRLGLTNEQLINVVAATLIARQGGGILQGAAITTPFRVATLNSTTQKVREPIWIVSIQLSHKLIKGTLRWVYAVQGGNGGDIYDNVWLQVSPSDSPCVIGPWDGTQVFLN